MPISINPNSAFSIRQINQSASDQFNVIKRLSSFKRINSASDDPAGSAIIQRQSALINGTNQGIRNANDAISLTQTAQGGLDSITENLQRIRELAVQAANSTTTSRDAIQTEINQLSDENSRISETSQFNGQRLFPGSSQSLSFQVGANANDQVNVNLKSLDNLNSVNSEQNPASIDVSTAESAQQAIEKIDADLEAVSQQKSSFGAIENRFSASISNSETFSINTQSARSRIEDADVAKEVSKLIQSQILQKASIAAASQANQSKSNVLLLLGNGKL